MRSASSLRYLHSTMYLLNQILLLILCLTIKNLHSTMYLLNHCCTRAKNQRYPHLHSTMYLLNPYKQYNTHDVKKFTFHYVSIKSYVDFILHIKIMNLHSTMYLLNPEFVSFYDSYNFIYIPLCIY